MNSIFSNGEQGGRGAGVGDLKLIFLRLFHAFMHWEISLSGCVNASFFPRERV